MDDFALVSDFDGTITDSDVYSLIAERYMAKDHRDYFADYRAGRITHFEAMQAFYHFAPSEPEALDRLLRDTKPDPQLADCIRRLEANGWDLIIVSAGSSWYIERILGGSRRFRHCPLESRARSSRAADWCFDSLKNRHSSHHRSASTRRESFATRSTAIKR